jgi:hypothetical protein
MPKVRENQPAEDDPRCLPSIGTLRRIRWPLQPRSRDPRTAFGGYECRWMTLSRHPGPSPDLAPVRAEQPGRTIRRFDRPRASDV